MMSRDKTLEKKKYITAAHSQVSSKYIITSLINKKQVLPEISVQTTFFVPTIPTYILKMRSTTFVAVIVSALLSMAAAQPVALPESTDTPAPAASTPKINVSHLSYCLAVQSFCHAPGD